MRDKWNIEWDSIEETQTQKNQHLAGLSDDFKRNGGASRSRTEVHGFAIRCMATLPTRL